MRGRCRRRRGGAVVVEILKRARGVEFPFFSSLAAVGSSHSSSLPFLSLSLLLRHAPSLALRNGSPRRRRRGVRALLARRRGQKKKEQGGSEADAFALEERRATRFALSIFKRPFALSLSSADAHHRFPFFCTLLLFLFSRSTSTSSRPSSRASRRAITSCR